MHLSHSDPLGYQLLDLPRGSSPRLNLVVDVKGGSVRDRSATQADVGANTIVELPRLLEVISAAGGGRFSRSGLGLRAILAPWN